MNLIRSKDRVADLSIQGKIKAAKSLTEPLQIGMDNGPSVR